MRRRHHPARLPPLPARRGPDLHRRLPERRSLRPSRNGPVARRAVPHALLRARGRGGRGRAACAARRAAGSRAEPRRGPHPARLRVADRRDRAHECGPWPPLPLVQAALVGRAPDAAARAALRDLRLPPAGRGHPPARRARGARRHPLVGSPRGLPLRGARADEGPDGQERCDRARRGEGRFCAARAAGGSRSSARRGGVAVLHADPRDARSDRQHRRRRGGATGGRARIRRRRSVSRRRGGQGHRRALGHGQRDRARVRVLARRRVRVRRLQGLRPQGARHHGSRCVGKRQAPLPRARARRRLPPLHGRWHR